MRLTSIVLAAALAATLTFQVVGAQEQGRLAQTPRATHAASPQSARFRARTANERLVTARNLLGDMRLTISQEFLNSPFALTPRQPNVNGRGWLQAQFVQTWWPRLPAPYAAQPWYGADGAIQFTGGGLSEVNVHLENAGGRRFLVECATHGSAQMRALTPSGATTTVNAANGAVLSVVTAPGEDLVTIQSGPTGATWRFLGCEITRIQ